MPWGEYHELPYDSKVEERILGPFSLSQLGWLVPGVLGSYKLAQNIPKLPFDAIVLSRLHYLIPLAISLAFAFFKDPKTNLSLWGLIKMKFEVKRRNRKFIYRRYNTSLHKEGSHD